MASSRWSAPAVVAALSVLCGACVTTSTVVPSHQPVPVPTKEARSAKKPAPPDPAQNPGSAAEASRGGDGRVEQDGGAGGGCSEAEGVQHGNGGKTREEACKGDEVDGEQGMAAATGKNRARSRPDSANGPGDCHEGSASGDSHDRDGSHGHGRGPMRREQVGDSGRVERSRSAGRFGGGDRWRERRRSRERGWGDRRTSWEAESRGNWRSLTTQVPLLRTLSARFLQSTFARFLHLLRFPSIHLSLPTG